MSNSTQPSGASRPAGSWLRRSAALLAAIPLILQPTGQVQAEGTGVNDAGGGGVTPLVLTNQMTINYDLNQLFPNMTGFQVVNDHPDVAVGEIQPSSSVLTITSNQPGSATFTVTASSGGASGPVALRVLVIDPGSDGKVDIADIGKFARLYPEAIQSEADTFSLLHSIPSRSVNGKPVALVSSLSPYSLTAGQSDFIYLSSKLFSDPEGDRLTITARSSDTAVVKAAYTDGGLSLEGQGAGSAVVTIQAADPAGGAAEITVPVTVERANSRPEQAKSVLTYWLDGMEPLRVPMDTLFHDADGDTLTYTYTRTVSQEESEVPQLVLNNEAKNSKPVTISSLNQSSTFSYLEEPGDYDYGVPVTRDGNTLVINDQNEENGDSFFYRTTIEVTAVDPHFPDDPVIQRIQILPIYDRAESDLWERTIFKDARMEIDLHQKFDFDSVTDATYHYYLADENGTVTSGTYSNTYSNAYIQGNKLIIEGKTSSEYGEGEEFETDHYRVVGLFESAGQQSEIIDGFDVSVEELPWAGSELYLGNHLNWPETIKSYTKSGSFFEDNGIISSGSSIGISWTYGTEGTVTVNAAPYWQEGEGETPAVTYQIRFVPHLPL